VPTSHAAPLAGTHPGTEHGDEGHEDDNGDPHRHRRHLGPRWRWFVTQPARRAVCATRPGQSPRRPGARRVSATGCLRRAFSVRIQWRRPLPPLRQRLPSARTSTTKSLLGLDQRRPRWGEHHPCLTSCPRILGCWSSPSARSRSALSQACRGPGTEDLRPGQVSPCMGHLGTAPSAATAMKSTGVVQSDESSGGESISSAMAAAEIWYAC